MRRDTYPSHHVYSFTKRTRAVTLSRTTPFSESEPFFIVSWIPKVMPDDILSALLKMTGESPRPQRRPPNARPKFVRLHPQDNGQFLQDDFYEGGYTALYVYVLLLTDALSCCAMTYRSGGIRPQKKLPRRSTWMGTLQLHRRRGRRCGIHHYHDAICELWRIQDRPGS